jgi:hypothetical protein
VTTIIDGAASTSSFVFVGQTRSHNVDILPFRHSASLDAGIKIACCRPASRCYPIWMDFSECMGKAEDPKQCRDYRDDYLECLHHRKEVRTEYPSNLAHALPTLPSPPFSPTLHCCAGAKPATLHRPYPALRQLPSAHIYIPVYPVCLPACSSPSSTSTSARRRNSEKGGMGMEGMGATADWALAQCQWHRGCTKGGWLVCLVLERGRRACVCVRASRTNCSGDDGRCCLWSERVRGGMDVGLLAVLLQ